LGNRESKLFSHLLTDHSIDAGNHSRYHRYHCEGGSQKGKKRFTDLPSLLSHLRKNCGVTILVEKGIATKRLICPDSDVLSERYKAMNGPETSA